MADKEIKSFGSYFTKKVIAIISSISAVFALVAGIWAFEAHYATKDELVKVEVSSKETVENLETQIAGALERQQQKSDVRYWQFEYDRVLNDIYDLKRHMARYPDDELLKQDYLDLLGKKKTIKEKLQKALDTIKVN
jgi:hypothetical protein